MISLTWLRRMTWRSLYLMTMVVFTEETHIIPQAKNGTLDRLDLGI